MGTYFHLKSEALISTVMSQVIIRCRQPLVKSLFPVSSSKYLYILRFQCHYRIKILRVFICKTNYSVNELAMPSVFVGI
jgi:hypothetical protein